MNALGFISLSAITVLASPRPIDPIRGTRNIVFDANLFIVDGSVTSCLCLLRYFIPDRATDILQRFSEERFQKAFIVANVRDSVFLPFLFFSSQQISLLPKDGISREILSEDLEKTDYAFQGDIIQVCKTIFLHYFNRSTLTSLTAYFPRQGRR
jgi:hypothetical protein